jgi:SPW repeat
MPGTPARPWTRIQDWVILAAGAFLALSPLWVDVDTRGAWAMVIIGVVIAVLALVALAMPGAYVDEGVMAAVGVVAFIAPWLFSYYEDTAAAWTSWIVGVVVAGLALSALPASREVYRQQHHAA